MKKITFLIFVIGFNFYSFSQFKEFIIIDNTSEEPIDLAQIIYPSSEIGSVSNKDGRIKIPLRKENLIVSHINFIKQEIAFKDFNKKDTIYLSPKTTELEEIVFYNLDLKKKLSSILEDTYSKEYSSKKIVHNTTYKETFSVNDSLSRLFQVQFNWWSKNSLFKGNKRIDKQNKIYLENVDYSKIKKIDKDFISANGAYVENKTFFQFLHLNFLLNILKNLTTEFEINSINKNANSINVYFDATLKQKGKTVYNHKNSLIVFDKEYKSIKHLKFNMIYEGDYKEKTSKNNKVAYQTKTTSHTIELSFKRLKNNKLSISYFISELGAIIKTDTFKDYITSTQSLFIAESSVGKNLDESNINFYEPFYKNIPKSSKNNDVKILLTKEEKEFLKSNKD